ncbi:formate dehydrogenase accessory sulfurtransferase FdhD [Corticibacter populi]|uniref:formate dehydrogenase accessory sulfurtransferase FdhD n=1 Tax=Corticibacter populi TaxID=1550736 RepID=UPI001FD20EDE|nr:formate dehydrogenase accessory sulfurtransferase FdhD [Corticibacter populi]
MTEEDAAALPPPLVTVPVQRHVRDEVAPWTDDQVVAEVPVALVFNGISHVVLMCTPQDLPELALGFALSEGIIERPADCYGIEVASVDACGDAPQGPQAMLEQVEVPAVEVRLEIASSAFMRLKERRRSLAGRTGCGVCGIDSLQALDLVPEPRTPPPWLAQITPQTIFKALAAMPAWQVLNRATGAVHAAAYAGIDGELVAVYEDVGRHNALDKLLGARVMAGDVGQGGQPWPQRGFVVMSSRASYELVRKCARLSVPLLATISAPTSLAIQVAETAGLQLWGLAREPRALRYTR